MSFDRLVEIIGPAPSELSVNEFLSRLAPERDRVREALALFKASGPESKTKKAAKKKSGKVKKAKGLAQQAMEKGISPQQLQKLLAAMEGKK